jgi:hypothetical protein
MRILIIAIAILPSIVCALPVKDGRVTIPHTIVALNDSQIEEIEALNTVTLTSDQWAIARKTMPKVRKRIMGVLPANWSDCTCCHDYQAILFPDNRLAIVHSLTFDKKGVGDGREPIRMGRDGQFYDWGHMYDFDALIALIRNSSDVSELRNKQGERLRKEVSPPPGKALTDADIYKRVREIYQELAAKGWNVGRVPENIEKP